MEGMLTNSISENTSLGSHTAGRVKLLTETASLLSNKVDMGSVGDDVIISQENNDVDEIMSIGDEPIDADLVGLPLPIVVAVKEIENDEVVAKVTHLGEETTLSSSVIAVVDKNLSKGIKSVFELKYIPLWGFHSICGKRPEMEDAISAVPCFMEVPIKMFVGDHVNDRASSNLTNLTTHFFGVYDGHGGSQVADYCRDRVHLALEEELNMFAPETSNETLQVQWEKVFTNCFQKVDDEVGGRIARIAPEGNGHTSEPVAPETVGTTAVVAVIGSSHIIIANCGDSRAVLYRGKEVVVLSNDHKPNREDEHARIEAAGGKVIQWNGHRVFGVLAMSRSIGDGYLKPWIIPVPEVTFTARAREDECLVLASDGLWDVMSNEEVCEVARKRILIWHKKYGGDVADRGIGNGVDLAAQAAADYLAMLALQKGSKDNISVIVVDLKTQRKFKTKS
uniref:protein phosphatase 2C 16-like n=1 Tax=Erigeron canadensis TaxID=72917 RepID=UPI001CB992CF|nr:protein phosphatase 2C 16-like [Erigeron canadensis]